MTASTTPGPAETLALWLPPNGMVRRTWAISAPCCASAIPPLAYRNRSSDSALVSPGENPKVIVIYRNAETGVGWKFRCTATEYNEGPYFDEVNSRLSPTGGDAAHTGAVVVLEIDQVLTLFGELLQEKEPGRRW